MTAFKLHREFVKTFDERTFQALPVPGMKFNCDRCKTRYSISDERVRGKVLKIRCKNCSAVITVREGMVAAAAPKTPHAAASTRAGSRVTASGGQVRTRTDSALRGAFDEAMRSPSASDSMSGPPATLTAEWYMAIDGEQSGPFDLEDAKQWVSANRQHDEVYCWSEGFDDWLPVEKVSHFRALASGTDGGRARTMAGLGETAQPSASKGRGNTNGASASGAGSTTAPSVAASLFGTPEKLDSPSNEDGAFSSLMSAKASAKTSAETSSSLTDAMDDVSRDAADSSDEGGAFEFDIGEASRVVNLASIMPPSQGLAGPIAAPANPGLPGLKTVGGDAQSTSGLALPKIAGATSPDLQAVAHPDVLLPSTAEKRSKILVPLLIASASLVLVLGVLLFLAFSGEDSSNEEIARRGGHGIEDLAVQFDPRGKGKTTKTDGSTNAEPDVEPADNKNNNGKGRPRNNSNSNTSNGGKSPSNANSNTNTNTKYVPPNGEVDLSGSLNRDKIRQGSLEWDDVSSVYRRKQFVVQRCYERAIKKNPLLRVGKTMVTLRIGENGRVSKVVVPSLSREDLGGCLVASIGKWRFPKSTEGWNGKFPILFRAN